MLARGRPLQVVAAVVTFDVRCRMTRWVASAVAVLAVVWPSIAGAQVLAGMALFEQHCGSCHSAPAAGSRAPDRIALSQRTPEAILEAITTGAMAINAQALTPAQKRIVAEQLALRPIGAAAAGAASTMKNACPAEPFADPATARARWSGWGADSGNSRYQPSGGLTVEQVSSLGLKWAFAFPNGSSAFGQPAVAGGRVYIGSDNGFVYSLNASSGCVVLVVPGAGGCAQRHQHRADRRGRLGIGHLLRRPEGQRLCR